MGGPLNFLFFFSFFPIRNFFFVLFYTRGWGELLLCIYFITHVECVRDLKGGWKEFFFLFSYLDTKKTDTYSVRNRVGWAQQLFLLSRFITTEISYERKWEFTHSCRDDDSIIFFFFPTPEKMKWNFQSRDTKKKKIVSLGDSLKMLTALFIFPIHTHTKWKKEKSLMLYYAGMCVCVSWRSQMKERPPWVPPLPLDTLSPPFSFRQDTHRREKKNGCPSIHVCVYIVPLSFL